MNELKIKKQRRSRRLLRTRKKIAGQSRIRLCVFRSNTHFYAQLIDKNGKTLLGVSDASIESKEKMTKTDKARLVADLLSKKAIEQKIKEVTFDKGAYRYHGRVKAFAEAAREGGLSF